MESNRIWFPAWSYAFLGMAIPFIMWVIWQDEKRRSLPRRQAALSIMRIRGVTEQRAYQIIREGNGHLWFLDGSHVLLRAPRALKGIAYRRGVPKKSRFWVERMQLGGSLQTLRALLSFPAMAARKGQRTPRAYTAKCLHRSLLTVSRYRQILRQSGHLTTSLPSWYETERNQPRRLPDYVWPNETKIMLAVKPSSKGIPLSLHGRNKKITNLVRLRQSAKRMILMINNNPALPIQRLKSGIRKLCGSPAWRRVEHSLIYASDDAAPRSRALAELSALSGRLKKY